MAAPLALADPAGRTFTSVEVARLAGVSYRVLDYWCRNGAMFPTAPAPSRNPDYLPPLDSPLRKPASQPGSGGRRRWSLRDVVAARALARLCELGARQRVLARLCAAIAYIDLDSLPLIAAVDAAGIVRWDGGRLPVDEVRACWLVLVDRP